MFRRTYAVAGVVLTLVLAGAAMIGCPPEDNEGTKVKFTVTAESLVPDAHFGKLFAVTHDNSLSVFSENEAVGSEFQEFDFMNDTVPLEASLVNLEGITEVFAGEEDLSGLGTDNDTLTFTVMGLTDDLFTIITPQFQTPSTFAALNAVPLPATGSQIFDLEMFSLNQLNKVVVEPGATVFVRVTITRN